MKTALNTLKDLVNTLINDTDKTTTLQLMIREAGQVPDTIKANSLTVSTDNQVRDYIYWQQELLVTQADLLHQYCLHSPGLHAVKGLIIILKLLKRLAAMFPEHFDNKQPMPRIAYLKQRLRYEAVLGTLSENFRASSINDELTQIALYPLKRFLKGKSSASYHDGHFLFTYTEVLLKLILNGNKPEATEEQLCSRLLTLNYNGLAFMDYLVSQVKKHLENAVTKKDKEIVLKRFRVWLKPIPVIIQLAFDQDFSDLKAALLDWAELEQEALSLPEYAKKAQEMGEKPMQKLDVSVGILAYLTRLCKVHGLYPGRTHAQVIDHMVETYSTKQTSVMSRDSFYNRYKEPTLGVATALRKILKSMVDDIDHFIHTGEVRDHTERLL